MRASHQTLLAVALGLLLGWVTAASAVDKMLGGVFIFFIASIINPIIVCLVARGWWTLVGIVPTLTAYVTLLILNYRHAHKYDGVDLSAFLHRIFHPPPSDEMPWGHWFLLGISLVVSVIMHGVRTSKASDFHDPAKEH
jgi:hypothetical protein